MPYDRALIAEILSQIDKAIAQLIEWNVDVNDGDDYLRSPEGMKTLAASCMLLEAIGEGVKKIDDRTNGAVFALCPDIPWADVIGMRNHIAHGYFDIDADIVYDVITNDIANLQDSIRFLREII